MYEWLSVKEANRIYSCQPFFVKITYAFFFKSSREKEWDNTEIVVLCKESRSRVEELIIMEMTCIIDGILVAYRMKRPRGSSYVAHLFFKYVAQVDALRDERRFQKVSYYVNFVLHNFLLFNLERVTSVITNFIVMSYLIFDELSYRCIQLFAMASQKLNAILKKIFPSALYSTRWLDTRVSLFNYLNSFWLQ